MEIGKNLKASARSKEGPTGWAFERIREAFEKVAKDEAGRLNIVQGIMFKSTDFQGASLRQREDKEVSRCLPVEDYVWWVSAGKKHCS